ncbi:MAG: hypothetical protein Q9178_001814 [Gyalolechia marmorata]
MPPQNGNPNDPRVTGEMIHKYLQSYAEDHDLLRRIRFNTFVESAKQCPRGWRLTFRNCVDVVEAEKLLVATGVTSIAYMPKFEEKNDGSIPLVHSCHLGANYQALENKAVQHVVVVGAAKSAYDAVYLLLSMGKKVTWVIRSGGAGPLAILPFKIWGALNSIAVASTRLMTHLSPSILNTRGPLYWFLQRTILGRWCTGRFWDLLDHVSGVHAGYGVGDHVGMLAPEIDRQRQDVFWAHSGLGVVTLPDFWPTLHSPNLSIVRDEIYTIKEKAVCLQGGSSIKTDHIIMCTGWGDHFGMFDAQDKAKIGLPHKGGTIETCPQNVAKPREPDWDRYDATAERVVCERLPFIAQAPNVHQPTLLDPQRQSKWRLYRRVVPIALAEQGDRSLAILGQIHTVQTPLLAEIQSFWAILYLLGEVKLPDVDSMATEVSLWNAWTRKRYLNQGQKFPYSLYDFLPYIDSLFEDLGLQSRRKSNFVAELFSPYQPHDFNGFIDEWLDGRTSMSVHSKV